MSSEDNSNLEYQAAKSTNGGSYTENKLKRLELPLLANKRFLDLGCNTGYYCRLAHEQGARQVVGVDNSHRVIEKARSESPLDINYLDTGWDDFPHGSYDVVILLSAIHYARNPRSVIRNIRRSLAKGGVLVLEGGVLFMDGAGRTDIPLPGWRAVGDRCLHLTQGFIRNHLLCDFEFEVKGLSEMRGGDDVLRYVLHARPSGPEKDNDVFTLDILDFFNAAKQSAQTIAKTQPAYAYVAALKETEIDEEFVSQALSNHKIFDLFKSDLNFCLDAINPSVIRLHDNLSPEILSRIQYFLSYRSKVERVI